MDDTERVRSFGDMVDGVERLTKPWRIGLLVTNAFWALIVAMLVWFAYMAPIDVEQSQDFQQQIQEQSYGQGVTDGN